MTGTALGSEEEKTSPRGPHSRPSHTDVGELDRRYTWMPHGTAATWLCAHRILDAQRTPRSLPKVTQRPRLRSVCRGQAQGPQGAHSSPGVLCTHRKLVC